ncbi:hypothetical protein RUND412_000348 [Rhizina undulata]
MDDLKGLLLPQASINDDDLDETVAHCRRHLYIFSCVFKAGSAVSSGGTWDIIWDRRVPAGFELANFDDEGTSMFNAEYVAVKFLYVKITIFLVAVGITEKWSKALKFSDVEPCLFDLPNNTKSIEVTINDTSIFTPSTAQLELRRSKLLPSNNNGTDAMFQGTTTFHFSVRVNPERPLGSSTAIASEMVLWKVNVGRGWHNWAVENNWDENTIAVCYSSDYNALEKVVTLPQPRMIIPGKVKLTLKY